MSGADPKSAADLRALARKSRKETLSKNDAWELEQAMKQAGSLSGELGRIVDGKS